MKVLNPSKDTDLFFDQLSRACECLLMLDYDGTLAPFRVRRDDAMPYEGVENLIDDIMEHPSNRVVIISGRWTRDLLKLITLKKRPEIWGSHGWERLRPDGEYDVGKMDESALTALTGLEDCLRDAGLEKWCEQKPGCIALHWRGIPTHEAEDIRKTFNTNWALTPYREKLICTEFDGGIEVRVTGRTKGYTVSAIMDEAGSLCRAAYLGDDRTDEDAFKALGKRGLSVLVRKQFRATAADLWITPPEELISFLTRWRDACCCDA